MARAAKPDKPAKAAAKRRGGARKVPAWVNAFANVAMVGIGVAAIAGAWLGFGLGGLGAGFIGMLAGAGVGWLAAHIVGIVLKEAMPLLKGLAVAALVGLVAWGLHLVGAWAGLNP